MRRIVVALAISLCATIPAVAQDAAPLPLVGVLNINTAANNEPTAAMLRDALAALGDIDRKSIRLDFRLAEGNAGRFPELAAALVRDNPSVIVAGGPPAVRAAQYATQTIPIVASVNDLVASGFIEAWPARRQHHRGQPPDFIGRRARIVARNYSPRYEWCDATRCSLSSTSHQLRLQRPRRVDSVVVPGWGLEPR